VWFRVAPVKATPGQPPGNWGQSGR
jgi:hypothetical protein